MLMRGNTTTSELLTGACNCNLKTDFISLSASQDFHKVHVQKNLKQKPFL